MTNLVLTLAVGDTYQKIAQRTHPFIKAYADRIGAHFMSIDETSIAQTSPHWEKFVMYDLFNKYERILYLDTDLLIRDDCPNLFDIVPTTKLGMFNEAPFTDRSKELMIDICKAYDVVLPEWKGDYYNSGVIVASRQHKYLFKKPAKEVFNFYEQSYLNMCIAQETPLMHVLDYRFNRMTCMDRFTGIDRHDSYIIHYAGYPNLNAVVQLIDYDIEKWASCNGSYDFRHHIYVSVTGGLGDQVAAEPAIRYMREKQYPDAEFIVATHWPRLFSHLTSIGVEVVQHGKSNLKPDTPYFIAKTLPEPDSLQWSVVSHLLCHSLDYSSIALMKRTLPLADKKIKLDASFEELGNLLSIIGTEKLDDLYIVHPGRHWQSKTFPTQYWQDIIDGLVAAGKRVAIVGKTEAGDPPTYVPGARGTVDVTCPDGAYDLRDLLDLGTFITLLSVGKVLISNDSAPIHLAGAFDNWIVLIPSCKNPDHILPWRERSLYHKAIALYNRLPIDEVESRPTQVTQTSAEFTCEDWLKYLMPADEIVKRVLALE